jgi:quinol monooxygenase YgiN
MPEDGTREGWRQMGRITAVTTLVAHAGRLGDLLEAVDAMVGAARAEDGTEAYLVSSARRSPDTLVLFEMFRDRAALKAHQAAGASLAERLGPLVARIEVQFGELIDGTGLGVDGCAPGHGSGGTADARDAVVRRPTGGAARC